VNGTNTSTTSTNNVCGYVCCGGTMAAIHGSNSKDSDDEHEEKQNNKNHNCEKCGKPDAPSKCSKCSNVYYCNRKCQKKDWKYYKKYVCIDVDDAAIAATIRFGRSTATTTADSKNIIVVDGVDIDLGPRNRIYGEVGRVVIGPNMINDETVNELNKLIGDGIRVRFALREKPMILVLEFINPSHLRTWCNIMNIKAYPMQRGVMMGEKTDSAVKIYPLVFRFPEEFYHLISYIRDGRIYYDTKTNVWKYRNKKDQGHFETGYGKELFQTWMERQFSRLTKPRIQTLLHRLDLVDDPTDKNLACIDTAHYCAAVDGKTPPAAAYIWPPAEAA
jgi:hypothetical protein